MLSLCRPCVLFFCKFGVALPCICNYFIYAIWLAKNDSNTNTIAYTTTHACTLWCAEAMWLKHDGTWRDSEMGIKWRLFCPFSYPVMSQHVPSCFSLTRAKAKKVDGSAFTERARISLIQILRAAYYRSMGFKLIAFFQLRDSSRYVVITR